MFLYNTYQWDWTTIAALVAPRPMLFANSDKDSIFPMDANRRVYKKLQQIYGMYGVEKAVGEYVSAGGHDYRPDLRKAIFHFFNLHLKRQPTPLVEDSAKYTPIEGKKLRVFPTDADLPKDAINHRIDELFIPAAKVALPKWGKFVEWKKEMIAKVRKFGFRNLPNDVPVPVRVEEGLFDLISTEPNIHSLTGGVAPGDGLKSGNAFLMVNDPKMLKWAASNQKQFEELQDSVIEKGQMFPLIYRGANWDTGPFKLSKLLEWSEKSPPNYVTRSHVLLGRTIDEGRVRDIIATTKYLEKAAKKKANWHLYGWGQSGINCAYAALFEPSIKEVIVIDPPKSHKEGPHFLNVLRVLDIPEALGLLAPTPLTIVGGKDAAFDRTEEIYRLAGAADKLTRK